MKNILLIFLFCMSTQMSVAQQKDGSKQQPDPEKKLMEVEASCGQCKLGLEGTDCDLAVKIDGKAYYVDGTKIDDHGDAHAKDGFCNAIRKAKVQGEVVNNRFVATYFKLIPEKKK